MAIRPGDPADPAARDCRALGNPTPRTSTSPATTRACPALSRAEGRSTHRRRCAHLNAPRARGGSWPATTRSQRRWWSTPQGLGRPDRRTCRRSASRSASVAPHHCDRRDPRTLRRRRGPSLADHAFQPDDRSGMIGYCKPEPGGLLVSPADETPSEPCDAKPEEHDVALGFTTSQRSRPSRYVTSARRGLACAPSPRIARPSVDSTRPSMASTGWSVKAATASIPLTPSPKPPQRISATQPGPIG